MRVLWFTNVPLPAVYQRTNSRTDGVGGGWMAALCEGLWGNANVKLGVASTFPGLHDESFEADGVTYYTFGQPARRNAFAGSPNELRRCAAVAQQFAPDVVHVHGTERFYGLLKAYLPPGVPLIVSLQGLLGPYASYGNFFGALSPWDVLRSTRVPELLLRLGLLWGYRELKQASTRERQILRECDAFLGRTAWDHAHATALNLATPYYHVGEVLRAPFAAQRWGLYQCRRHSIVFTNAGHPRRGCEVLIDAVALLRREFPDVTLRFSGTVSERSGYGRFLRMRIARSGLADRVSYPGFLDATQMARELANSHVFAIASYIENSPNSLAEAMTVGMPCVASFVGGIPDMIEDGTTGLMFPAGDAPLLAERIARVFRDDALAISLGAAARDVALQRHSSPRVVGELLNAYRAVLATVSAKHRIVASPEIATSTNACETM